VALTAGPQRLQVWDLRLIRRELHEIGLDWDLPPFPPAADLHAFTPLQLDVNEPGGQLRARLSRIPALFSKSSNFFGRFPGSSRFSY
jgi:hypothetical protein